MLQVMSWRSGAHRKHIAKNIESHVGVAIFRCVFEGSSKIIGRRVFVASCRKKIESQTACCHFPDCFLKDLETVQVGRVSSERGLDVHIDRKLSSRMFYVVIFQYIVSICRWLEQLGWRRLLCSGTQHEHIQKKECYLICI